MCHTKIHLNLFRTIVSMHIFYMCKPFLHKQRNVAVAKINEHAGFLVYGDIEKSGTPEKQTER